MQLNDWLAVHDTGDLAHEWTEIYSRHGEHEAIFRVSRDAAMVRGVRHSISARDQQLLGDRLGALLLTAKLYELRYRQAAVHLDPVTMDPVTTTSAMYSARVDTQIKRLGMRGAFAYADVCKTWILDSRCSPTEAANHGLIVSAVEVRTDSRGRTTWKGIPVQPCAWLENHFIIQLRGSSVPANRHGLRHGDYSQGALYVHEDCEVDGEPAKTAMVYLSRELCGLVTHDAKPLGWVRHPGVGMWAESIPTPAPDTLPSDLGLAVLAKAREDLDAGVRETSPNDGPRIREYARHFGLTPPINWCAVAVGTWIKEAAEGLDWVPPIAGSAGAQATMHQFRQAGRWVDRKDLSEASLKPGNVPVWRRGPVGDWRGHVGIIEFEGARDHTMGTIEGNSGPRGDRVSKMTRSIDDERLFGVGILNDQQPDGDKPAEWTEADAAEYRRLVKLSEAVWEGSEPMSIVQEMLDAQAEDTDSPR